MDSETSEQLQLNSFILNDLHSLLTLYIPTEIWAPLRHVSVYLETFP